MKKNTEHKPTLKALRADPRYLPGINFDGNRKLVNTPELRFMIWNLPTVITCPYRTALCEKSCYARKAENVYGDNVTLSRARNFENSRRSDFADRMIYTIETELNSPRFKGRKVVFRIHESGDFYNAEYMMAWKRVAKHFDGDSRIVFLAYTKSLPYLIPCGYLRGDFPDNLVIRSSIWADTRYDLIKMTVDLDLPIYTAAPAESIERGMKSADYPFEVCRCEDCATCGKCWNPDIKKIVCAIH